MQKQEGCGNLVNQSEAKDGPNVAPFVDSQSAEGRQTMRVDLIPIFINSLIHFNFFLSSHADHAGNGTKRLRAMERKRRPTQQTTEEETGSSSRTLRNRSKMILSPTMDHGKAAGKRMETDKLTVEQSDDRREEHEVIHINRLRLNAAL